MDQPDLTALYRLTYGMYVIAAASNGRLNGQIANTVFQITSEPATVAVSINKQNLTHQYIRESRIFSVSVLQEDTPMPFIAQFGFRSGRDLDKFAGTNHRLSANGVPVGLDYTLAFLEAKVIDQIDCGTHTLFIGQLLTAEHLAGGEPMTYAYYHQVKRGTAPSTAPTFIKTPSGMKGEATMEKYKCQICGYVYDPQEGDPDNGIKPGTPFSQLPDDWVCPICGADKSAFERDE